MAYKKQTWVDDETVGTADRFNHMESGIEEAGKTGGVSTGAVIGWNGGEVPEGYEENSTMLEAIANAFFPIGYTFIDTTGTIDYSNHLGLVWEKTLQGVTPVGQKTSDTDFATVGKTGGEKTHKLTQAELPKVSSSVKMAPNIITNVSGTGLLTNVTGGDAPLNASVSTNATRPYITNGSLLSYENTDHRNQINLNFGNDQAHNNLQPYQVVTFWTRVG